MEQKETVKKASRINIEDVQKRNREYDSLRNVQAAMTGSKVEIRMLGATRPHPYTKMLTNRELRSARTNKEGEITMEATKCCFCGKTINDLGNNPSPACTIPDARCCDKCDDEVVIPIRQYRLYQKSCENKDN